MPADRRGVVIGVNRKVVRVKLDRSDRTFLVHQANLIPLGEVERVNEKLVS